MIEINIKFDLYTDECIDKCISILGFCLSKITSKLKKLSIDLEDKNINSKSA